MNKIEYVILGTCLSISAGIGAAIALELRTQSLIRNQTTLLKNVSEQLSELRSDFTVLPNPEGLNEMLDTIK